MVYLKENEYGIFKGEWVWYIFSFFIDKLGEEPIVARGIYRNTWTFFSNFEKTNFY